MVPGRRSAHYRRVLTYAAKVVVILMGAAGATVIGAALQSGLGWRRIDARDVGELSAIVARALGRREHLLVHSRPLTPDEQQAVRGDFHGVRFVDLAEHHGDTEAIVGAIRNGFGI